MGFISNVLGGQKASSENQFWKWFKKNITKFENLKGHEDPILDDLLSELQKYNKEFYFEMSSNKEYERELIITVEGKTELFETVENFVKSAPSISGWKIIALKPPMGFDYKTNYEGIEFSPKTMWFLPLENKEDPKALGLRIGIPDYKPENERVSMNAVLVILDTSLGECSSSSDVNHVEISDLPSNPDKEGYIMLQELPSYIAWRKKKLNTEQHAQQ